MDLPRRLSLFTAIMLVVGNVVGAGIFTTTGVLAADIQSPMVMLLIWGIGGLITLCGALTYAELGAMFPRAGGDYQFLKEAYGPIAGFLVGWLSFWVINPGSIAALSIAVVSYLPRPSFLTGGTDQILAVGIVLGLSYLNYRSTTLASRTQSVITVGSLVLLAGFIVGAFLTQTGSWDHFSFGASAQSSRLSVPGTAMIAVLFTYSGWFAAAYVGSEVKHPGRNVPLSLLIGTLIITVLYTAINAAYLYALPIGEIKGMPNVASIAAERLFGRGIAIGISIAIVLAIASCINATVMTSARVCYAMAIDGLFFSKLRAVHPRYQTPHVAVVAEAAIAVVLVIIGTFDALLTYVVFAMVLASIATGIGHVILRIRRPDLSRPYRTFGYPLVPIIFIGTYGWVAVSIAKVNPTASLIGLGLAITGVPFYYVRRSQQR
ncbi:MAG: amino acid permease [Myxococcota bacterium]|nr:amino acid permease [Myxococcota bacterium]